MNDKVTATLSPEPQRHECKPHQLLIDQERRVTWFHEAPHGVTLEQVLEPVYWRSVWREFQRGKWPEIRVVAEDGSWDALLKVFGWGEGFAKVAVLWKAEVKGVPGRKPNTPEGYRIEYIKGQGWRSLDPAGDVICQNQMVEDEALRIAAQHAKSRTA
jgi:hypothetical protein